MAVVNSKASVNRDYCLTVGRVLWCNRSVAKVASHAAGLECKHRQIEGRWYLSTCI